MEITQAAGGVCAAKGFFAGGVHCGIRKNTSKLDLALIYSETPCAAAAVYTKNKVCGAPITVTRAHLSDGRAQAIICNSGNANTCNADGVSKAQMMCAALARELHLAETDIAVASTGVIGQPLPIDPILSNIAPLIRSCRADGEGSLLAGTAIMTTDTHEKEYSVRFSLGGKSCHIGGIAKGSGMIEPNMATMLCFITTDAAISPAMLQKALSADVQTTFNMVSIDGDTSTNDTLVLLANGAAKNPTVEAEGEDFDTFCAALHAVTTQLCRMIAKDGEGATKLLTCTVRGADGQQTARKIAKSVIKSTLFKCAVFGCDANWGRILCAIGYTEAEFEIDKVAVWLCSAGGKVQVCESGAGLPFSEDEALQVLQQDEVTVLIDMGSGSETATAWGCDLSYDYVKINGDYRT